MKDIMLDETGDLLFKNGDLVVGESGMQDVGLILQANQGEWKESPVIGANLVREVRGNENKLKRERNLRIQLKLDGKNYDDIKNKLRINPNLKTN